MKKYKRLLGSSRESHFREPKKSFRFFSVRRRQSVRFRSRYAKSVLQRFGSVAWRTGQIVFVSGVAIWCFAMLLYFFHHSPLFKIKAILYRGDVPASLTSFVPLKSGQAIFSVRPAQIEADTLKQFKALKDVSVRRTWTRNVIVTAQARVPVAVTIDSGRIEGVDIDGAVFPLVPALVSQNEKWPLISAQSDAARVVLVNHVATWKKAVPEFYSLVEYLETDNMLSLTVGLKDGVKIIWGLFDEKNVIEKAQNILRLRELYAPGRSSATLRFVDQDRIVMGPNWVKVTPK